MVRALMHTTQYQTVVTNGQNAILADTLKEGAGGRSGFNPLELLEAALAACTNLTLRIAAEKQGIPVLGLSTTVTTDGSVPGQTEFVLKVAVGGELTEAQRTLLLKSIRLCLVGKILSAPISISHDMV